MKEKSTRIVARVTDKEHAVISRKAQVLAFLDYVCEMPFEDFKKHRAIINIFVNAVC